MPLLDNVRMSISSVAGGGTGTLTLGSAVAGYRSFSGASAVDGEWYPYEIREGTAWETGIGQYTASGTTLSRGLSQSSTGSLVTFTSAAIISVVAHAEWLRPAGCRLTNSGTINFNTTKTMTWDQEDFDTDAFHSTGASTENIVVPTGKGFRYVELTAHFRCDTTHTSGIFASVYFRKNTATVVTQRIELTTTNIRIQASTGLISCVDADILDVVFESESDTSVDVSTISSLSAKFYR